MDVPPAASCPRCQHKLDFEVSYCPGCGLTLGVLDELYGEEDVLLERINDAGGVLDEAGRAAFTAARAALEKEFPQLFLAVFVGTLATLPTLRQFGFWLLNRGAIVGPQAETTRLNEYGLLVLADPEHCLLGVVTGYQIEPWLPEETISHVLEAARPAFPRQPLGVALARLVTKLARPLRHAARAARTRPPRAPRAVTSPLAGLRRLREGHLHIREEPTPPRDPS